MLFLCGGLEGCQDVSQLANPESVRGTENNATYLTLPRERGHKLVLVITTDSKLSLSHWDWWLHVCPSDLPVSWRGSAGAIQEEMALGLIIVKTDSSAVKPML